MEKSKNRAAFVLLAAGSARRMGREKLLLPLAGKTAIAHCAAAIAAADTDFCQIVIAVSPSTEAEARKVFPNAVIVQGGATRAQSVKNALEALEDADVVAIHDAARCLVTPQVIDESIRSALLYGSGVAAVSARDTVRYSGKEIDRTQVTLAQTPQSFSYARILQAYRNAEGNEATDDCELYEKAGFTPCFSDGDIQNQKLTYPEDIGFFEALLGGGQCG